MPACLAARLPDWLVGSLACMLACFVCKCFVIVLFGVVDVVVVVVVAAAAAAVVVVFLLRTRVIKML